MGKPGIPPYGKDFQREDTDWHPVHASRAYVLRKDSRWFIRADKTSERWTIYCGDSFEFAEAITGPLPTFGEAMAKLLDGIHLSFYAIAEPESEPEPEPKPEHFSADGKPVLAGRKFWNNDLRVVRITGVAVSSNAYADTGCTQTWHRTTHSRFDTLDGHLGRIGRLARYVDGLDAENYEPGTYYADVKGA